MIDTNKEKIAIEEANRLNIPVIGVIDSNSTPESITYPVPGNDDAMRAIHLYCDLVSGAVLAGIQAEMTASGVDIGAVEELAPEDLPDEEFLAVNDEMAPPVDEEGAAQADA